MVDSGLIKPMKAANTAKRWFIFSLKDKYVWVILKLTTQKIKRIIIAKRMEILPICFDAKINTIPVRVRIKLNIFNVFDWIFKFESIELSPFCINYSIYGYGYQ